MFFSSPRLLIFSIKLPIALHPHSQGFVVIQDPVLILLRRSVYNKKGNKD